MISSRPGKIFFYFMRKQNLNLYIRFFFALIFAAVALFFISNQTTLFQPKIYPPILYQGGVRGGNSQSASISAGNIKLNLQFAPNTLFYDTLVQAKNAGKITFSGKNYPGLGFFVTDIGSLHSGNGKNLLYYINGKEAQVGVSSYTLNSGDTIEWKLK